MSDLAAIKRAEVPGPSSMTTDCMPQPPAPLLCAMPTAVTVTGGSAATISCAGIRLPSFAALPVPAVAAVSTGCTTGKAYDLAVAEGPAASSHASPPTGQDEPARGAAFAGGYIDNIFTAPEPPTTVFVADYLVMGNIGVRGPVCEIGRRLRVGAKVQRISPDSVRVIAVTPDVELMIKFTASVRHHCIPGSVERKPVRQSSDAAFLALSKCAFRLCRSSFQHRSGNDGDEVSSRSKSSSSRELPVLGFPSPREA